MGTLGSPKNTIDILKKHGFAIQKKFGQNFLVNSHVIEKIIRAAGITREDFVLEIGPGIGTLTQYLCEKAGKVLAVEIDKKLIPILDETLSGYDNVTIINDDILKADMASLVKEYGNNRPAKIVANLPYYITTPIIMEIFERHIPLSDITIMVQKEVADRIQAKPGSGDYGALSLAVQYYARPELVANVPPNCFIPRPKVGSAVIKLVPYGKPVYHVEDEGLLFMLVRASFNQRRKTFVNGIANFEGLKYGKDDVARALDALGIDRDVRGEALSLEQFAAIANYLSKLRIQ